jgi:hypothetical protein
LSPVYDKGSPECESIGSTVFVQEVGIPSQRKRSQHPGVAIPRSLFGVRKTAARCVDSMDGVKVDNAESVDHKKTTEVSNEGSLALSDSVNAKESTIGDRAEQKFNNVYYNLSSLFTPVSTNCIAADEQSISAKTALPNAAVEEGQTDQSRKRLVVPVSSTVDAFPASGWKEVSHRRKPKLRKAGDPLVGRSPFAQSKQPVPWMRLTFVLSSCITD